ncbi:MAG: hypothetical protein ABIO94_03475 [Opitutaceae bacterium]
MSEVGWLVRWDDERPNPMLPVILILTLLTALVATDSVAGSE